jgi:hypothetical protein
MLPGKIKHTRFFMQNAQYFCPTLKAWNLSKDFHMSSISNFTEIRPVGAALIQADRRTHRRTT